MDLKFGSAEPTAAERAAVDALLGAPPSSWESGARGAGGDPAAESDPRDLRVSRGGHEARGRRHLLLPALHALQDRVGWISEGGLDYVCRRLTVPPAEAWGVASFYHLLATEPRPPRVAHVCDDLACRTRGAEALCAELERRLGPPGTPLEGGRATWLRSPCLGQCERAPAALLFEAGEVPQREVLAPLRGADAVARALEENATQALPAPPVRLANVRRSVPQAGAEGLRLLARVGVVDPTSLAAYRAAGGYRALARAVELGPAEVIAHKIASKLVGRGGAAFPTGRKWEAVARAAGRPRYVVCNADESEPGTF